MPSCYKLGLIKTLVYRRYRIHNSWAGFDKDLKDLKNVLQKIQYDHKVRDHAVKSNLNDKVNCRNQKSSQNTESEIKIRLSHHLLDYIRNESKRKVTNFAKVFVRKRFSRSVKVKLVFASKKLSCVFRQKIHIKVNTFPKLSLCLFVLAVMLVMSVRLAGI